MRLVKINPSGLSGPEWRVAGWRVSISEVRTMTADNSAQQRALDRLEPLIQVKLTDLQNSVGLRKRRDRRQPLKRCPSGARSS
jgi:CHASE3 domain sensor protein